MGDARRSVSRSVPGNVIFDSSISTRLNLRSRKIPYRGRTRRSFDTPCLYPAFNTEVNLVKSIFERQTFLKRIESMKAIMAVTASLLISMSIALAAEQGVTTSRQDDVARSGAAVM